MHYGICEMGLFPPYSIFSVVFNFIETLIICTILRLSVNNTLYFDTQEGIALMENLTNAILVLPPIPPLLSNVIN